MAHFDGSLPSKPKPKTKMKTRKLSPRGLALGALVLSPALITLAYADDCPPMDCSHCGTPNDCIGAGNDAEAACLANCSTKPPEEQEACNSSCSGAYTSARESCEENQGFCISECEFEYMMNCC